MTQEELSQKLDSLKPQFISSLHSNIYLHFHQLSQCSYSQKEVVLLELESEPEPE